MRTASGSKSCSEFRIPFWAPALLLTVLVSLVAFDGSPVSLAPADPRPPLEADLPPGLVAPEGEVGDADPFEAAGEQENEDNLEFIGAPASAAAAGGSSGRGAGALACGGAPLLYAPKQGPPPTA